MTLKEQIMKLQTYKMYEGEDTVYVERDDVLKLLEQEPCECKQVDIDKFKEILKNNPPIISVLEQEPCEDCISRKDVMAIIEWAYDECKIDGYTDYCEIRDLIKDMPTVTPKAGSEG